MPSTNGNESTREREWLASHDGIHSVFVNEESNSMLMSMPPKYSLWPSVVDVSPKFFQCTSQSPRMFHEISSFQLFPLLSATYIPGANRNVSGM